MSRLAPGARGTRLGAGLLACLATMSVRAGAPSGVGAPAPDFKAVNFVTGEKMGATPD